MLSRRSFSALMAALLCTSCLVSEEPFIPAHEATLPLKNGTVLQKYVGDKESDSSTYSKDVVLNIVPDKYYVMEDEGKFRVRPIAGTPYLLVMGETPDHYVYGLLGYNSESAAYIFLQITSTNLDQYLVSRPGETPQNLHEDGMKTFFQDRADLERVIVAMAEQGYYDGFTAYRPVQATAQQQPEQPEQSLTPEAVIGGLIGLGILAWMFSGSGDDGGAAGSSSGESSRPCGKDYKIEPSKLPCGNEYRPKGQWKAKFWCYTDYNMQIGGSLGVTYCTNGAGTWERSGLFDHCNGEEGWCDWGQ